MLMPIRDVKNAYNELRDALVPVAGSCGEEALETFG
jgi:hypothetical protein